MAAVGLTNSGIVAARKSSKNQPIDPVTGTSVNIQAMVHPWPALEPHHLRQCLVGTFVKSPLLSPLRPTSSQYTLTACSATLPRASESIMT